jgi:hypothetical protein
MKLTSLLLLLIASSALAQSLNLDKAPLLDAPGPGYRGEVPLNEEVRMVLRPLSPPALSMLQATTIADREMQARGLSHDFILRAVTFVRGADARTSLYIATISGLEPATTAKHREFRIDMQGAVTFREDGADPR